MPAGPIGSCWAVGTWADTAWEENTWGDAGAAPATGNGSRGYVAWQAAVITSCGAFLLWVLVR